jgi:hypothetical protein
MTSSSATPTRPDDSAPARGADSPVWQLANPRRTRRA